MVPPAAVMENEPPGFFPVPRGDFRDPRILRICHFSGGFKFYGKLKVLKQQCQSVLGLVSGLVFLLLFFFVFFFLKLRDRKNLNGPRLAVVIGEDSCFLCLLVCAFTMIVPTQNGPLRSDGKSGLVKHWSGTAVLLVSFYRVSTAEAR